jgi:hypothetical protein
VAKVCNFRTGITCIWQKYYIYSIYHM